MEYWVSRHRDVDSMAPNRLERLLAESRWRPYQLGTVAALPFAAALVALAWLYSELVALAWFSLYPFWAGLDVFHKTPLRKMISMAMFVGTLLAVAIIIPRLGS
jgi:hypothetical protein